MILGLFVKPIFERSRGARAQTDAFNYRFYHFLCKRGIRPARTEQFLVALIVIFTATSRSTTGVVGGAGASPHPNQPPPAGPRPSPSGSPLGGKRFGKRWQANLRATDGATHR